MKRRDLLLVMGALAAHSATRAQEGTPRKLGLLSSADYEGSNKLRHTLIALRPLGFVEGRNLSTLWRFAKEDYSKLGPLARELVAADVDAILTIGTPPTRAAFEATRRIPIVTGVSDPVGEGFARTEARPGGNVTGLSWGAREQARKQLELLRALMPRLARAWLLVTERTLTMVAPFEHAAREAALPLEVLRVRGEADVRAFLTRPSVGLRAAVCTILPDVASEAALAHAAIEARVALMGYGVEWVKEGGLLAHDFFHRHEALRFAAVVAAILRGVRAGDLPFELPDGEWLGVNRATARALGLVVPQPVRVRAELVVD